MVSGSHECIGGGEEGCVCVSVCVCVECVC